MCSPVHCVAGPDGSVLILDGSMGLDVPQSNASHVKAVIAMRPLSHDLGPLFQQFADGRDEGLRRVQRCYVSQPPPDATMVRTLHKQLTDTQLPFHTMLTPLPHPHHHHHPHPHHHPQPHRHPRRTLALTLTLACTLTPLSMGGLGQQDTANVMLSAALM